MRARVSSGGRRAASCPAPRPCRPPTGVHQEHGGDCQHSHQGNPSKQGEAGAAGTWQVRTAGGARPASPPSHPGPDQLQLRPVSFSPALVQHPSRQIGEHQSPGKEVEESDLQRRGAARSALACRPGKGGAQQRAQVTCARSIRIRCVGTQPRASTHPPRVLQEVVAADGGQVANLRSGGGQEGPARQGAVRRAALGCMCVGSGRVCPATVASWGISAALLQPNHRQPSTHIGRIEDWVAAAGLPRRGRVKAGVLGSVHGGVPEWGRRCPALSKQLRNALPMTAACCKLNPNCHSYLLRGGDATQQNAEAGGREKPGQPDERAVGLLATAAAAAKALHAVRVPGLLVGCVGWGGVGREAKEERCDLRTEGQL